MSHVTTETGVFNLSNQESLLVTACQDTEHAECFSSSQLFFLNIYIYQGLLKTKAELRAE